MNSRSLSQSLQSGLIIDKDNYFITEDDKKTFKKRVLQLGVDDARPKLGSQARVMITFFDNIKIEELDLGAYKSGVSTEVTIGEGDSELAHLLDVVVQTMRKNEWCYIRTKLKVPEGNEQEKYHKVTKSVPDMDEEYVGLKFNVKLESFSCVPDIDKLEPTKKIEFAEHHKVKGNELFVAGRIEQSCRRFMKAIDYLKDINLSDLPDSFKESTDRLTCVCHLNMALGYLKLQQFDRVIESCDSGLKLDPDNMKGLYRRSQAYIKLGRYMAAKVDLERAHEKDPSNTAVVRSLQFVKNKVQ